MNFKRLIDQIKLDLAGALPGKEAHDKKAPKPRTGDLPYYSPAPDAKRGGVLLLLYPDADQLHIPLIVRPRYEGVHSGQVAFPGGRFEEGDGDLTTTALREAKEEVGIDPMQVQILGQLSDLYIYASNYLVQPTVGWCTQEPTFCADPREVDQLLKVPVTDLQNPANHKEEQWHLRDRTAMIPFFAIQGQTIWGATAMMLSEFLSLPSLTENPIK